MAAWRYVLSLLNANWSSRLLTPTLSMESNNISILRNQSAASWGLVSLNMSVMLGTATILAR